MHNPGSLYLSRLKHAKKIKFWKPLSVSSFFSQKKGYFLPWGQLRDHVGLITGHRVNNCLFGLQLFSILASAVHPRGKLKKLVWEPKGLGFSVFAAVHWALSQCLWDHFTVVSAANGQRKLSWGRGHQHAALLVLFKRDAHPLAITWWEQAE